MAWVMLLTGLIMGSFFNVCIHRLPDGTFFKSQRSHCPHCGTQIPWWLNIPLISFLLLRGRTACCSTRISLRYPLVEIAGAALFIVAYWKHPFLFQTGLKYTINLNSFIRFAHLSSFSSILLVCSVIDMKHQIIPDKISLPMIGLSPLWIWLHPELDWKSSLIGTVAGYGIILLIAHIYIRIRNEQGIGMGDGKLLAGIGGWLGYQAIYPTLFWGSILGSVFGITAMIVARNVGLRSQIPFGPFLATGALLHMLIRDPLPALLMFR